MMKKIFIGKFPEPTQKEKLKNRKKKLKSFFKETRNGILMIFFVIIIPIIITYFCSKYLGIKEGNEVILVLSVIINTFAVSWVLDKLK